MLPPYDSRATLDELERLITETGAQKIFCMGDNYHDDGGEIRLETDAAQTLRKLTSNTEWVWISGNHDRNVSGRWGGIAMAEWTGHGIALRHEATKNSQLPEISGHYHPKIRVPARGRHISRRCFVRGPNHLIMPAFGALTGGLDAGHPAIENAIDGPAQAVMGISGKVLRFPLFSGADEYSGNQPELPLVLPR